MAKINLEGFTYRPRAGTETAKLHAFLMANPELSRADAIKGAVKIGFDESTAKSWIRGLVTNGNAPGRFPNGVQNVPNDKERNQKLAGTVDRARAASKAQTTKPAKQKRAAKKK